MRQAGLLFAAPTYAFLIAMFALVAVGLSDAAGRGFHTISAPHVSATEGIGVLLILRAFASGSTAMTGIEAISDSSAIVFVIAGITKFTAGAWVAVLTIGLFALVAVRIRRHYDLVGEATALHPHAIEVPAHKVAPSAGDAQPLTASRAGEAAAGELKSEGSEAEDNPEESHNLTIVPVATVNLPDMRALAYSASLQQPLLALHISPTASEAERFRGYWRLWGDHLPLEVVISPHRAIVAPMINYISSLHRQRPDLTLTVILPEIIVRHWWHRVLHNGTAGRLRRALRPIPKIVVTTVPFHLASYSSQ